MVGRGSRVFLAATSFHDRLVVDAITEALRERGATVDVLTVDMGADRELTEVDEVKFLITRPPTLEDVYSRTWGRFRWVEELCEQRGYNVLIQCVAGPIREDAHMTGKPYYYERIPWVTAETLASAATTFPRELFDIINERAWRLIWEKGRGGRVRVTDPEGTDITFTLWEEYYVASPKGTTIPHEVWRKYYGWLIEGRPLFGKAPYYGHLAGHPFPPLIDKEDATGVVCGTLNHMSKPFPRIRVKVENGVVTEVEGGGKYGEEWRKLLDETKDIKYPDFPRPGLFWLSGMAIGTNPKAFRDAKSLRLSGYGTLYERLRSGIIHVDFGTHTFNYSERWAAENGFPYGHIHVHLNFPTYEITTKEGDVVKVIDKGRLTALDDPEVRQVASKYGDPDELLREDWVPAIPGINYPGDYEEYARDPASWIRRELEELARFK
jgi:hypothetical protein